MRTVRKGEGKKDGRAGEFEMGMCDRLRRKCSRIRFLDKCYARFKGKE